MKNSPSACSNAVSKAVAATTIAKPSQSDSKYITRRLLPSKLSIRIKASMPPSKASAPSIQYSKASKKPSTR